MSLLLTLQPHNLPHPQPFSDERGNAAVQVGESNGSILPKGNGSQRAAQGQLPQMNRPHQQSERPQSWLMVEGLPMRSMYRWCLHMVNCSSDRFQIVTNQMMIQEV